MIVNPYGSILELENDLNIYDLERCWLVKHLKRVGNNPEILVWARDTF